MAIRAWSRGWPGIEPIEQQLAREKALAQQDPAVLQAERLARASLVVAGGLYKSAVRLSAIAESLTSRLEALLVAGDLGQLDAHAALTHMKTIARVMRDSVMVNAKAVESHQLVAGLPTSIVANVPATEMPVDFEAARATHERLGRALRRVESHELSETDEEPEVQQGTRALVSN
jgi:hypothetical protein